MTIRSVAWLIPCALLAVGACTPSSSNPGIPNEVPDAAIDAAIDAAPDGAIDAPPDAPPAPGVLVANAAVVDLGISQPGFFITAPFGITNTGATPVGLGTLILSPPFEIFFSNCQGTLAPGASCLVEVSFTPTAIGLTTGTASLRSSANTVSVALEARGGFGLDVGGVIEGASVTSDPAGLGPTPGGDLQGVFATAVTLTAVPPPGGAFLGWDPVCGDNGPTCVVPVPDDRNFLLIRARFQAPPPVGPKVTVTFAGGSTGQVRMFDDTSDAPITTCVASPCVGVVPEGHHVTLFGFSSSQFGGWTGDCVSTTHDCDLGTVTSDRAAVVTFNRDPGEVVSFVTDDVPHWVAFAPDGGLYVSYLEVRKLRLDGTVEWRFPKVGVHDMASDAAGNLYAVSGRELFSLSPDGALRWSTTVDLAPNFLRSIESGVQVSSDGTIIAVHTADGARVLDGNGNDRFALTGLTGIDGFALAPDGTIAIGVPAAAVNRRDIRRWTRDGTPLPTIPSVPSNFDVSLAFDAGDAVCALTVGAGVQTVSRTRADRVQVFRSSALTGFSSQDPFAGIGVNSAGTIAVVRSTDTNGFGSGVHVDAFSPTGSKTFTLDKRASNVLEAETFDGVQIESFAVDRQSRRVAIVGRYALNFGWIEVLELP